MINCHLTPKAFCFPYPQYSYCFARTGNLQTGTFKIKVECATTEIYENRELTLRVPCIDLHQMMLTSTHTKRRHLLHMFLKTADRMIAAFDDVLFRACVVIAHHAPIEHFVARRCE